MFPTILLCSIFYITYALDENLTLDLVQVIFRHGERTPLLGEAQRLNITNSSIYETDFGQLTKRGMRQEYTFGQMLRKHYDKHLGKYSEKNLVANTTLSTRTKASLELVLASLFPLAPDEQWLPNFNWRPVPYTVAKEEVDAILYPQFSRNSLKRYYEMMDNEAYEKISTYDSFFQSIEKWTGEKYNDKFFMATQLYNILNTHKILKISVPDWCTDEVFKTIVDFTSLMLTLMSSKELNKFNGGTMIKHVIENIENNEDKQKKMYLFSTHDLTLIGFQKAQNLINDLAIPPFGSAFIVESYKDSQQNYYLKILKWDGSSNQFDEVNIANCERYCPVDKYKSLVKYVIPTDEEIKEFFDLDDCPSLKASDNSNILTIIYIVIGVVFVIVITLLLAVIIRRRMRPSFIQTIS